VAAASSNGMNPIYYSSLRETRGIPDISDLSDGAIAVTPATTFIHAVHVADDQIACGYVREAGDIAEPARDWFNVASGEPLCEACRDVIQPDPERRAPRRI
jgi:hypothetical protein